MSSFLNKLIFHSSTKETTSSEQQVPDNNEDPMDEVDEEQQPMTQRPEDTELLEVQECVDFETEPITQPAADDAPFLAAKLHPNNNSNSVGRLRSISRVFTPLPPKLPSYQQMLIDIVEYWCHVCMLETVPEKLAVHKTQLEAAIADLNKTENSKLYLRKGRLYSRLELTNLTIDVCLLRVDGRENVDDDIPDAKDMNEEHWTTFKERLILAKSIMLKKNCNVMPAEGESLKADEYPDRELSVHDMMNSAYNHVHTLLDVQIALSTLSHDLEKIAEDDTEPRTQNLRVERAVNRYIANLKMIFSPEDEQEEGTEKIPSNLNNFLLHDMYSPTKKAATKPGLALRLMDKIRAIQIDSKTPQGSLPGAYSFANVQQKMHSLLLKWTESILEIPALVKLGYGEVISPVIETEDDDDVSSFGNNHEENDTKIQQDELNPHMTQLSFQSIERLCRAARGSNITLTDKEKAIIERINTKRQRSCSDNSLHVAPGLMGPIPCTNITNNAAETLADALETTNNILTNEEKRTMKYSSFQNDACGIADKMDSAGSQTSKSNSKALKLVPTGPSLRPNHHKSSMQTQVPVGDKEDVDSSEDDEPVVRYSKRIAIWACPDVQPHKVQRKLDTNSH